MHAVHCAEQPVPAVRAVIRHGLQTTRTKEQQVVRKRTKPVKVAVTCRADEATRQNKQDQNKTSISSERTCRGKSSRDKRTPEV